MEQHFNDYNELNQHLKTKPFAMISAHRNDFSSESNQKMHEHLKGALDKLGYNHTPVEGIWGGKPEQSLMVHGIDENTAKKLADAYKQYAVVHSEGGKHTLHERANYLSGQHSPTQTGIGHEVGDFADNYSIFPLKNGQKAKIRLNMQPISLAKADNTPIKLIHYSHKEGLKEINPEHMGSGVHGAEKKRGIPDVKRSFYYRENTKPEDLVTQGAIARYHVELDPQQHKLYDINEDTHGLVTQAIQENNGAWNTDKILNKIKNHGFVGYHNSASALPNVVGLFHTHPVKEEFKIK